MGVSDFSCYLCVEDEQCLNIWNQPEDCEENDDGKDEGELCRKPPPSLTYPCGECDLMQFSYEQDPRIHGFKNPTAINAVEYSCDSRLFSNEEDEDAEVNNIWERRGVWFHRRLETFIVNVCNSCFHYFIDNSDNNTLPPSELLTIIFEKHRLVPYVPYDQEISPQLLNSVNLMYPLVKSEMRDYIRGYMVYIGLGTCPDALQFPFRSLVQSDNLEAKPVLFPNMVGATMDGQYMTPLQYAISLQDYDYLEALLKQQPKVNLDQTEFIVCKRLAWVFEYWVSFDPFIVAELLVKHWSDLDQGLIKPAYFTFEHFKTHFTSNRAIDQFIVRWYHDYTAYDWGWVTYRKNLRKLTYILDLGVSAQNNFHDCVDTNWRDGVLLCQRFGASLDPRCYEVMKQERVKLEFDSTGNLI